MPSMVRGGGRGCDRGTEVPAHGAMGPAFMPSLRAPAFQSRDRSSRTEGIVPLNAGARRQVGGRPYSRRLSIAPENGEYGEYGGYEGMA
jgi:hypothetical protein